MRPHHGTNSRYVNQACRCDSCRAAHHRALKLNNTARHRARVWLARENPVRYRELLEMAYHDLTEGPIPPVGHPRAIRKQLEPAPSAHTEESG